MNDITLISIILSLLITSIVGLTFFSSGLIDSIFDGNYTKSFFGAILMIGSMLALCYLIP